MWGSGGQSASQDDGERENGPCSIVIQHRLISSDFSMTRPNARNDKRGMKVESESAP